MPTPAPLLHRAYHRLRREIRDLHRQRWRSKVAFTEPSPRAACDLPFSAHELVCHGDLLLAICSAKAANLAMDAALPWVFHDDGSLTPANHGLLAHQFPGCRVITRNQSDEVYAARGDHFELLRELRKRHVMLLKLADLHMFSDRERIFYCDSDVLFLNEPSFLISKLNETNGANYFNKDISTAYITAPEIIRNLTGTLPLERINAGLSVLNRSDISFDRLAAVLSNLAYQRRCDWSFYDHLIEQTAVAVLTTSSSSGARHLPCEYDLCFETPIERIATRHYVGKIRHRYELEGLAYLVQSAGFFERWNDFIHRN